MTLDGFRNRAYTDEEQLNSGEKVEPPKTALNGNHHRPPVIVPDIKIDLIPENGHVEFNSDSKNSENFENGNNNGYVGSDR